MEWYEALLGIPTVIAGYWLLDKQKKFIGRSIHGWEYRSKPKSKHRGKYRR